MARVPIINGNSVALAPVARARIDAVDTRGGTMGGFARGLMVAGDAFGQAAQAQEQMDDLFNQAAAKRIDNEYVAASREMLETGQNAYFTMRGFDAANARAPTEQGLRDLRERLLSGATTEQQRMMATAVIDRRMGDAMERIASHATSQIQGEEQRQSEARMENFLQDAIGSDDDARREEYIVGGLGELRQHADRMGMGADTLRAAERRYRSEAHVGVVQRYLSNERIDDAKAYLDSHRDAIDWQEEARLDGALQEPLARREAESDADRIMGMATGGNGTDTVNYSDPLRGAGRAPVSGGQYGAARTYGGRRGSHQGVDYPAAEGTPIYSMAPGTVRVTHSALGGNIVEVDHGGGRVTRYMHMGRVDVRNGDHVTPDSRIGTVGMTGRTSGPHLHLEVRDNGRNVDPSTVIGHASSGPRQHDLASMLSNVDSMAQREGWTPERRQRAISAVEHRVQRDDALLSRQQDQAYDDALTTVDRLGRGFTDVSQLPAGVLDRLSPRQRIQLRGMAEQNARPDPVSAHGETQLSLRTMAIENPDQFIGTDLRQYRSAMTPGEYETIVARQAEIRTARDRARQQGRQNFSVRGGITSTINTFATPEMGITGRSRGRDRSAFIAVYEAMEADLVRVTNRERQPTEQEYQQAFRSAVRNVSVHQDGWFSDSQVDMPRYRVGYENVPPDQRQRITQSFQRTNGRAPTHDEIVRIYRNHVLGE